MQILNQNVLICVPNLWNHAFKKLVHHLLIITFISHNMNTHNTQKKPWNKNQNTHILHRKNKITWKPNLIPLQLKPHIPPPILLQLQTPLRTIEFHITNKTSMKTKQKKTFPSHIEQQNNYHTCYQHIVLKLKSKTLPSSIIATTIVTRGTKNIEMKKMLIFKMKINVKCNPNLEACIICHKRN